MKKHFTIIVNDQKVKILKFKKDSVQDRFTSEEIITIELITKMDSPVFGQRKVKIEIEDEPTIIGTFLSHFSQPGLHRYKYRIVSESDVR